MRADTGERSASYHFRPKRLWPMPVQETSMRGGQKNESVSSRQRWEAGHTPQFEECFRARGKLCHARLALPSCGWDCHFVSCPFFFILSCTHRKSSSLVLWSNRVVDVSLLVTWDKRRNTCQQYSVPLSETPVTAKWCVSAVPPIGTNQYFPPSLHDTRWTGYRRLPRATCPVGAPALIATSTSNNRGGGDSHLCRSLVRSATAVTSVTTFSAAGIAPVDVVTALFFFSSSSRRRRRGRGSGTRRRHLVAGEADLVQVPLSPPPENGNHARRTEGWGIGCHCWWGSRRGRWGFSRGRRRW